MKSKHADKVLSMIIAMGCYFLLEQLEGVPPEGKLFPSAVLWLIIFCCIALFVRSFFVKETKLVLWENGSLLSWSSIVVIFILYVMGIFYIGFFSCTLISSAIVPTLLSRENWKKSIPQNLIFSVSLTFIFYLFFAVLMSVRFPDALFI